MHYSGLLVLSRPNATKDCVHALSQCHGIEVFVTDESTGRIVAVLETESVEEQEDGLRRAQGLPNVISAELVYHYFGEPSENITHKEGGSFR